MPAIASTTVKPVLPTRDPCSLYSNADPFSMTALDFSQDLSRSTPNIPDKANNNEPAEQSRNVSVSRQNAFYNMDRPSSVKRRSLQPGYRIGMSQTVNQQAMKEARTAFIQSEVTKPNLCSGSVVDMFDPLAMGSDSSLSSIGSGKNVTGGLKCGAHVDNGDSQDDLLKEWNLDSHFTKMKINKTSALLAQHPPVPPQAPASTVRPTITGGAGFGGNFTGAALAPRFGMGVSQPYKGVPKPYQSSAVYSLLSPSDYNHNSVSALSSNSAGATQLAPVQQWSHSPSHANRVAPPMLRPLSRSQRAPSPEKPNRESRGASPAIAQTIASLNAAAEYHGNTKPKTRLAAGSVRKVITNIEKTQTNLDILNELSFLQNSSDGASSERNTPSPSLRNSQTQRNQWETFD